MLLVIIIITISTQGVALKVLSHVYRERIAAIFKIYTVSELLFSNLILVTCVLIFKHLFVTIFFKN